MQIKANKVRLPTNSRITTRDLPSCIGNDKASEPGVPLAVIHHKSLEVIHLKMTAIRGEKEDAGTTGTLQMYGRSPCIE